MGQNAAKWYVADYLDDWVVRVQTKCPKEVDPGHWRLECAHSLLCTELGAVTSHSPELDAGSRCDALARYKEHSSRGQIHAALADAVGPHCSDDLCHTVHGDPCGSS